MQSHIIFLCIFATFSALICLSDATPMEGSSSGEKAKKRRNRLDSYTPQEENLIYSILTSLGNPGREETWDFIEKAFKHMRNIRADGFYRDRSAGALKKYFYSVMMEKDWPSEDVPEFVKNLQAKESQQPYSDLEEDFINEMLLNHDGKKLTKKFWEEVKREHDLRVGTEGFVIGRSTEALKTRFYLMKTNNRLSGPVKRKFESPSSTEEGSSSSKAKKQAPSLRGKEKVDEDNTDLLKNLDEVLEYEIDENDTAFRDALGKILDDDDED